MAKATVVTTIRLPVDVREKLDAHAQVTGESLTAIIVAALGLYLD